MSFHCITSFLKPHGGNTLHINSSMKHKHDDAVYHKVSKNAHIKLGIQKIVISIFAVCIKKFVPLLSFATVYKKVLKVLSTFRVEGNRCRFPWSTRCITCSDHVNFTSQISHPLAHLHSVFGTFLLLMRVFDKIDWTEMYNEHCTMRKNFVQKSQQREVSRHRWSEELRTDGNGVSGNPPLWMEFRLFRC